MAGETKVSPFLFGYIKILFYLCSVILKQNYRVMSNIKKLEINMSELSDEGMTKLIEIFGEQFKDELHKGTKFNHSFNVSMEYEIPLACVAVGGERCNAHDFVYRGKYDKPHVISEVKKWEDISDINDGTKYEWYQVGDSKYGRYMYCPKTQIKRSQTMGEFYGGGIVD